MSATRPSDLKVCLAVAGAVGLAVVVHAALPAGPPLAVCSGIGGTAARLAVATLLGVVLCVTLASLATPRLLLDRLRLAAAGWRAPTAGRLWLLGRVTVEEAAWRGCLLPVLAVAFGAPLAVVASSVVFGLMHAHQGRTGVLANVGNGVVFALSYLLLGGLPAAVATHAAHNFTLASILVGRRRRGARPHPADHRR